MKYDSLYAHKNVLVTGGAGFIGSHLCAALVAQGARVTVLDNFSTGSRTNLANIHDSITIREGDITDANTCERATKNQDIVFHCAALVSVPEAEADPAHCFATNIHGTFTLLDAASRNGVKRAVFSSSAAVYGPQKEACHEGLRCAPTSVYGYSKLIGELLCKQLAARTQLTTVILRYFNVFGERQNPHHPYAGVVARFTHALAHNLPITIFGDGSQTRDFVPVSAVVDANLLMGILDAAQCNAEVFNVGTGTSISLNAFLADLQKKYPAYTQEILYQPARVGDIHTSHAVCDKLLACKKQFNTAYAHR